VSESTALVPEWSGARTLLAPIASFGRFSLMSGPTGYAASSEAEAPAPASAPPGPRAAQPPASAVTLAPPAMSALIGAQEYRRTRATHGPGRASVAARIDRQVYRLANPAADCGAAGDTSNTAPEHHAGAAALSRTPVDFQT